MSSWWRDLLTDEHVGSEIVPDLEPSNGIIVQKSQYDSFYGTDLEDLLAENTLKDTAGQLFLTGQKTPANRG